jgi:hypothetical protein
MGGGGASGTREGQMHLNMRLLKAFYQAQAAFYTGGDDTASLRGVLADDIAWHVPGRSPIAGHYHGHQEVCGPEPDPWRTFMAPSLDRARVATPRPRRWRVAGHA